LFTFFSEAKKKKRKKSLIYCASQVQHFIFSINIKKQKHVCSNVFAQLNLFQSKIFFYQGFVFGKSHVVVEFFKNIILFTDE